MKSRLIILISLAMICPRLCNASDIKVKRIVSEGSYVISGILDEAKVNGKALISVKDSRDNIKYIIGTNTDASGEFLQKINLNGTERGTYKLYVGAYDLVSPIEQEIYFADSSMVAIALSEINHALAEGNGIMRTIDSISDAIDENTDSNAKILGLDNSYYIGMDSSGKTKIESILKEETYYQTAEAFIDKFYEALALAALGQSNNANIANIVDEFSEYLRFSDCVTYPLYESLCQYNHNIISALSGTDVTNVMEAKDAFNEKISLKGIELAQNIGECKNIYVTYHDLFDFSKYGKWTIDTIAQKTAGKEYESYRELYDDLDKMYSSSQIANSGQSGGSNSGSGGGSKGKNNSTVSAPVKVQTIPERYSFNDLENYAWAKDAIENLYKKQIVSGYGDGLFRPERNITREEFVVMTLRAFNLYETGAVCSFSDVREDFWAYTYIACAYEKGIINGMDAENFGTGQNITRQDMAVVLERATKIAGLDHSKIKETLDIIDKDEISKYATNAVEMLYKAGIINGYEDGSFKPKNNATRAETAVMINRILQK